MVVSVIRMPAAFMPKSSPLWIRPGHAVHEDAVAGGGRDVEDDVPALAGGVAGPVVVRRSRCGRLWCSCRWRRRRCNARARWRRGLALLLLQPAAVVGQFERAVQRHHVVQVQLRAARPAGLRRCRSSPAGTLAGTLRPQDLARRLAEELPVLASRRGSFRGDDLEGVLDLRRQQVAVLVADIGGRALQVHEDPAVALAAAGRRS